MNQVVVSTDKNRNRSNKEGHKTKNKKVRFNRRKQRTGRSCQWTQREAASWPVSCALYETYKRGEPYSLYELGRFTTIRSFGEQESYYRLCRSELGMNRPIELEEMEEEPF